MPSFLKRSVLAAAAFAILAAIIYGSLRGPTPRPAPVVAPSASSALADSQFEAKQAAARLQAEREQVKRDEAARASAKPRVQRALRAGLISKVDAEGLWVRPAFYELELDQKEAICAAVYAWSFGARSGKAFFLYDSRTGHKIGVYGDSGLSLN